MIRHKWTGASGQRGIALVVVLWGLVLLAIVSGGIASGSRTDTTLARNTVENARARALADAGVYRAIVALSDRRDDMRWRADGTPYRMVLGGGEVLITVQDERGKVDLNKAPDAMIRMMLVSAELDDSSADALVDAIVDFRDKDDLHRLNGAEDRDYSAAGLDYGAKDAPFEAVDELRRVLGMTPAIYRRVAPMFTVHSGRPGINPSTAPREVLLAITGIDAELIETLLAERIAGSEDPGAAIKQAVPRTSGVKFTASSGRNSVVTIRAEARLPGGAVFVREAILRVTGRSKSPFLMLEWRHGRRPPPPPAPTGEAG